MLGWLKRAVGWALGWVDEPEEEPMDVWSLSDEEVERYKALLADYGAYAHMNWEEFREYIRSQGLPPPSPMKKRLGIGF